MNKEIKEKLINEFKKTLENEDEKETENTRPRIFATNETVEMEGKHHELCTIYTLITKALIENGIMDDDDIKKAHDIAKMSSEEIFENIIKEILGM